MMIVETAFGNLGQGVNVTLYQVYIFFIKGNMKNLFSTKCIIAGIFSRSIVIPAVNFYVTISLSQFYNLHQGNTLLIQMFFYMFTLDSHYSRRAMFRNHY